MSRNSFEVLMWLWNLGFLGVSMLVSNYFMMIVLPLNNQLMVSALNQLKNVWEPYHRECYLILFMTGAEEHGGSGRMNGYYI